MYVCRHRLCRLSRKPLSIELGIPIPSKPYLRRIVKCSQRTPAVPQQGFAAIAAHEAYFRTCCRSSSSSLVALIRTWSAEITIQLCCVFPSSPVQAHSNNASSALDMYAWKKCFCLSEEFWKYNRRASYIYCKGGGAPDVDVNQALRIEQDMILSVLPATGLFIERSKWPLVCAGHEPV